MSTAVIERRALRTVAYAPAVCLSALSTLLFLRLLPDVSGKPWHEDEAVAGLIAARPLGELMHTVVLDRGGAPLHFLLAHFAFAVDGSPQTLRWLSLVFALATVPVCYDLARRLAGQLAGLIAAALAATSQLLAIYGTFGRMYALFAFASALGLDLFVRAVDHPRRESFVTATLAALLPLAVHPFGVFLVGAELAAAIWLWRSRAVLVALVAVPLVLPYVRLSARYAPDVGMSAPEAALRALGGSAGGYGVSFAVFALVAAVGAWTLPRAFAVLGLLVIVVPPVVLTAAMHDELSPRHLIFMLPVWTTFVAAGLTKLPVAVPVAVIAIVVAAYAPAAVADPRTTSSGDPGAVAAPAAWLRTHVKPGDVLYPYSAVFLAALPDAGVAHALPREPVALQRAVRRLQDVRAVFVAIPLRKSLNPRLPGAHAFRSWLILEHDGPFAGIPAFLARAAPSFRGTSTYASVLQLRGAACGC